jgi:hypothetical protein
VPWKHLGETVDARSTHNPVEFFSTGELIKTHVRKPKGKQTDFADYPPVMWNQGSVVKLMRRTGASRAARR